jgi:selenocysteine lyase/cysteine desulfurase
MVYSKLDFSNFRNSIVGIDAGISTPFGEQKLVYADWVASGRLYRPIESIIQDRFAPLLGNTHSESSTTGAFMTRSYHEAQRIIKKHVNASEQDYLINAGSGMTGVVNKLIRLLGLRIPEQLKEMTHVPDELRPVVFITHIEHHSNQTSWLETLCDTVILEPEPDGTVGTTDLIRKLEEYKNRPLKIGSFSACSNVSGIKTPYYELAKVMHRHGGYCFVDFACSAPYVDINMHPADPEEHLDAIFFSTHKFLGGPGSPGILIFNSNLYHNSVPDEPGGGTVDWTNPWGKHKFINNIEAREDGGTPPFLQTIKAALAIKLKEQMQPKFIQEREAQLLKILFAELDTIPHVHILASNLRDRLGVVSFYLDNMHYNLAVKLLNDRFGIQTRGGCSCAGTYGHYLLHVDPNRSQAITDKINNGDLSDKPGWVRVSIHPTMTEDEMHFIGNALRQIVANTDEWSKDYQYISSKNEFVHKSEKLQNIVPLFEL